MSYPDFEALVWGVRETLRGAAPDDIGAALRDQTIASVVQAAVVCVECEVGGEWSLQKLRGVRGGDARRIGKDLDALTAWRRSLERERRERVAVQSAWAKSAGPVVDSLAARVLLELCPHDFAEAGLEPGLFDARPPIPAPSRGYLAWLEHFGVVAETHVSERMLALISGGRGRLAEALRRARSDPLWAGHPAVAEDVLDLIPSCIGECREDIDDLLERGRGHAGRNDAPPDVLDGVRTLHRRLGGLEAAAALATATVADLRIEVGAVVEDPSRHALRGYRLNKVADGVGAANPEVWDLVRRAVLDHRQTCEFANDRRPCPPCAHDVAQRLIPAIERLAAGAAILHPQGADMTETPPTGDDLSDLILPEDFRGYPVWDVVVRREWLADAICPVAAHVADGMLARAAAPSLPVRIEFTALGDLEIAADLERGGPYGFQFVRLAWPAAIVPGQLLRFEQSDRGKLYFSAAPVR